MKRELKFRAWDNHSKRMVPDKELQIHSMPDFGAVPLNQSLKLLGITYELMQFIGLLDKNWKEIYEGDICKVEQTLYVIPSPLTVKVIYNEKWARFEPVQYWKSQKEWKTLLDGFKCDYTFEVIGNIYENPELLKAVR